MTDKQPEALRFADKIEVEVFLTAKDLRQTASELRRQHAEIQRLQDVNKELLDASEDAVNRITSQLKLLRCDDEFIAHETQKLRVAIAKATKETKGETA